MRRAGPDHDDTEDPIARRLARSGIRLGDGDLRYLIDARVTLDAVRAAVTAAALEIRARDERHWALPRHKT